MAEPIIVQNLTNEEFIEKYAHPGRIGIVGGTGVVDRLINRGQRHQMPDRAWSLWSHAFLFQGRRTDGQHWIIESDLAMQKKHIRLGVQENRASKYHAAEYYNALAVIDLGLTAEQEKRLMTCALDLVAAGTMYSLREIAGTLWALRNPSWRPNENRLAREQAFYCSAFVRHVFSHAGIELAAGIAIKNTTPEDIARTPAARQSWMITRSTPALTFRPIARRLRSS
jgi:hypothetical protein